MSFFTVNSFWVCSSPVAHIATVRLQCGGARARAAPASAPLSASTRDMLVGRR